MTPSARELTLKDCGLAKHKDNLPLANVALKDSGGRSYYRSLIHERQHLISQITKKYTRVEENERLGYIRILFYIPNADAC